VLAKLGDGGERGAVQGFSFQDRKPDLYLIKPGGPRVSIPRLAPSKYPAMLGLSSR
jgi:hypothetical protein